MNAQLFPDDPVVSPTTASNWIAVASAEHARHGRDAVQREGFKHGFMQVGHGKRAPLARIKPGDRITYYAPFTTQGGTDKLQSFVSLGIVLPGDAYEFDMGGGFVPWRRNVHYLAAKEARIAPLIEQFEFVENPKQWGYKFRFGLFNISDHDMRLIATAMEANLSLLSFT